MRHRKVKNTLDRKTGPRHALIRGLAQSLVLYEKIITTDARARAIRPYVEKIVSLGKQPSLANRRLITKRLTTHGAAKKVVEVLGPRYANRPGGYLRITKLGLRVGDAARQVVIEFI